LLKPLPPTDTPWFKFSNVVCFLGVTTLLVVFCIAH
jgi:hypothetical protein